MPSFGIARWIPYLTTLSEKYGRPRELRTSSRSTSGRRYAVSLTYSGSSTLHVRVDAFCHSSLDREDEKRSLLCCSKA